MDLLTLLRITIKRWAVVVPVLLLALAAAGYLLVNRGTEYTMRGSYVLVSSEALNVGGAQLDPAAAADALGGLLEQPSVRRQLQAEGLSSDYTVTVSETSPSVRLQVRAPTAGLATGTAIALVEMAPSLLAESYGDTSAATITARPLTAPDESNVIEGDDGTFSIVTSVGVVPEDINSGNPFPPTQATVRSLVAVADSVDFERIVESMAPDASFEITGGDPLTSIINVTVTAPSFSATVEAYELVRDQIQAELTRLQNSTNVNPDFRTVFREVVEPVEPDTNPASVIRPIAGVVILGGGLAVAVAALAEVMASSGLFERFGIRRLRAIKARPATDTATPEGGDSPGAENDHMATFDGDPVAGNGAEEGDSVDRVDEQIGVDRPPAGIRPVGRSRRRPVRT